MTAPGTSVSYSSTTAASPNKPGRFRFPMSNVLAGAAELPSGYKGFATAAVAVNGGAVTASYTPRSVTVDAVSLPADNICPWRLAIYAPDGTYAIANGLPGYVPTVGTPRVRLTDNGPSRAVVRIPVTAGIVSSSFSGWSDSHAEAVARGMELTVEYRTPDGSLVLAFRGRIFEIESGEYVTVTAYDRIMDLALFSDQYVPPITTYNEDETSTSRSISGTTYTYTMASDVGTVNTAYLIDTVTIDAVSKMTDNGSYPFIAHQLPVDGSVTAGAGSSINHVKASIHGYFVGGTGLSTYEYITATFYLLQRESSGLTVRAASSTMVSTAISSSTAIHTRDVVLETDVSGWIVGDTPGDWYVGAAVTAYTSDSRVAYATLKSTTGRYTTNGRTYYKSYTETTSDASLPEIAVRFTYTDPTDVSASLTVSGTTVSLDQSSIPQITEQYTTVDDYGTGIVLSYLINNAIPLQTVVEDLVGAAGCVASIPNSLGLSSTTYYTSATYDYLTCIHELIREADAGVRDSLSVPGTISVLPRHTVDENPVETFSTAPADVAEQGITSYSLTARWMAERATVAILAENATSSGLPIALETDDWLMTGSLVSALSTPMRSVTADTSSGTHALLANAAGGKIVQLHTNTVEGSVTLAGYRPDLWDLTGSGEGGLPVALTVPEYGISDTVAIPTEMEIADGVTVVTLDNIRRADRSEIANSMGLTADAISSASSSLPDTVWIFGRADMYSLQSAGKTPDPSTWSMRLFDTSGTQTASITDPNYLKYVRDGAGYWHAVGVIPAAQVGSAFEVALIAAGDVWAGSGLPVTAVLDVPKYVLANQNVHIDLRFRAA